MKSLGCPNKACPPESGSIIRYGFYNTSLEKRPRYRCVSCAKTFCANKGPFDLAMHSKDSRHLNGPG